MRKTIIVISGVLIIFLLGCNVGSSVTLFDESAIPPVTQSQNSEYKLDGEVWPFFLPDEISPIPGVIDSILADEQTIQIFFHDVPEQTFTTYLEGFQNSGYTIQYLLYAGEEQTATYDAVELLKDNIDITIEYENNAGVMIIDIGKLGIKVRQGPGWPAVLQGIMPQEVCNVETLYFQTDGTIDIMCLTSNGDFLVKYTEQLTANGYQIVHQITDQDAVVYQIELAKGKTKVEIRKYNSKKTGVSVRNY